MGPAVVFFHAHPDDEAIFTGGTMARLSDAGHRVVVIVATGGELGLPCPTGERERETERAAALLGVAAVHFLGYRDSGVAGDPANQLPGSLWSADVNRVAAQVATIVRHEHAGALVVYDEFGIYGHPDHVQVHRAGVLAAEHASVPTVYEATIDREYLHFVETHLVEEAILAGDLGLARSHLGVPSVMVTTTVSVAAVLARKRAAMAAHASQIAELQIGTEQFAAVYGWEWFVRRGPWGALDDLAV